MNNEINFNNILPLVQKPGRYINNEWNSRRKNIKPDASVCFCFPDIYEIGASNLGIEILYHIVNNIKGFVAERCFCPMPDMEEIIKSNNLSLFSLETKTPLKDFDIIGFSLQYELCVTNVLNMISLSGLNLLSNKRDDIFPLIIGGGPVSANPEPFADFFDAFVLGDGEEAIEEILELVKRFKFSKNKNKQELFFNLSNIEGVYVPSLYNVDYGNDGRISCICPISDKVPLQIKKRSVKLENTFFPVQQMVPCVKTVHSRFNVEIARGCPRQCRFCQAARFYWPWRVRSKEKILDIVDKGLKDTGYEEVSFLSLSSTDYKELENILEEVNSRYSSQKISISVPSLRCDQFSLNIAKSISGNKRSGLTFAPEAGSSRLREVIGKDISNKDVVDTVIRAYDMGWRLIKLYFMVGLPTETEDDIESVNDLVRYLKMKCPKLNFNITLSCFVPKPQTPFQWVEMEKKEILYQRLNKIRKILPASVKYHNVESSILEAILARGDRRLSKVILEAWNKGCRFDQWNEGFKYNLWIEAFNSAGIDPQFYIYRKRDRQEILPWEHLIFSAKKDYFWIDYEDSKEVGDGKGKEKVDDYIQENITQSSKTLMKDISTNEQILVMPKQKKDFDSTADNTVQKIRLRFSRKGDARYNSHLDQIEMFRRAFRRSGLPLIFSSGFHPQPKMSFGPAISVGFESESEYVEAEFKSKIELIDLEDKINNVLPLGYKLISFKKVPIFFPSLDSLVNEALYEISILISDDVISKYLSRDEIIIEKKKKGKTEKINIKPLIVKMENNKEIFQLQLRFGPKQNIKPDIIIQNICGLDDNNTKLLRICRRNLYIEKKDGTLVEP